MEKVKDIYTKLNKVASLDERSQMIAGIIAGAALFLFVVTMFFGSDEYVYSCRDMSRPGQIFYLKVDKNDIDYISLDKKGDFKAPVMLKKDKEFLNTYTDGFMNSISFDMEKIGSKILLATGIHESTISDFTCSPVED